MNKIMSEPGPGKLRICLLSKADRYGGGASKVAEQLAQNLTVAGHKVIHLSRSSRQGFNQINRPLYGSFEKLIKKIHWHLRTLGFPEILPMELPRLLLKKEFRETDVFHFHDISGAISPFTILILSFFKPVIWTAHDCSIVTAGCIYPLGCERFNSQCGPCPQIGTWPLQSKFDFTRFLYKVKLFVLRHARNLTLVSPSEWLKKTIHQKVAIDVKVISNGTDQRVYYPLPKNKVRASLSIDEQAFVIATSANSTRNVFKGFYNNLSVLEALRQRQVPFTLLVIGRIDETAKHHLKAFNYINTGFIEDASKMNEYLNAADLLLHCAEAENQPLGVIEAASTGLPVFGFDTGGTKECVPVSERHRFVKPAQRSALVEDIEHFASQRHKNAVDSYFSLQRMVEDYEKLYVSLASKAR
jgi:glycosyltransferase involved in cell wall biosynthesis